MALAREGLLSEERFVETFVASHARRGHGPVWIRAELERRGIPAADAARGLEGCDADWPALARETREKRFGDGPPADFRERAKQSRFLQYRGYTAEQVRQAFSTDDD